MKKPHVDMFDVDAVHCMVDIETLGSGDDAPIVQIGAVLFHPLAKIGNTARAAVEVPHGIVSMPGTEFNKHIKPSKERMGSTDFDTLQWWMAQGRDAQMRVFDRSLARVELDDALCDLESWSRSWGRPVNFWWSDMDFDLRLLRAAWEKELSPVPCPYGSVDGPHRGVRDVRTIKALGRDMGMAEPPFVGIEHDALDDAWHQTHLVCSILRKMAAQRTPFE